MSLNRKRITIFATLGTVILILTILVIKLASGYRPDFTTGGLRPTGLLVATSIPDGAQIYLNGKLKTATDETLNLSPDEYQVEIRKDGFHSWKKTLIIKKELVTETDAHLFSSFPDLKALTFTGAENPILSPDKQKVVFSVATASATKKGLWVLDLGDLPLGLARSPRQIIASAPGGRDFTQAGYQWSPDSKQILVTLADRPAPLGHPTARPGQTITEYFILDTDRLNEDTQLIDISTTLDLVLDRWKLDQDMGLKEQISNLPKQLLASLENKVDNLQFSPDETKILYTATASASIPAEIIPPLPSANSQPEERNLEPGRIYVYDIKEDRNFFIRKTADPGTISWFPTSKHLFLVQTDKITILEYDNTNYTDVYSGPFENSFAFPFPGANRLLILTSINPDTPPNLYAVTLR